FCDLMRSLCYTLTFSRRALLFIVCYLFLLFFFFNATAPTEIYTLSLHDALPIYRGAFDRSLNRRHLPEEAHGIRDVEFARERLQDRKSTRLNSSHLVISYAVFCLKKKKNKIIHKIYTLDYKTPTSLDSTIDNVDY